MLLSKRRKRRLRNRIEIKRRKEIRKRRELERRKRIEIGSANEPVKRKEIASEKGDARKNDLTRTRIDEIAIESIVADIETKEVESKPSFCKRPFRCPSLWTTHSANAPTHPPMRVAGRTQSLPPAARVPPGCVDTAC